MRTHLCGNINESLINQTINLCGWVDVARDLGGVCFIDLRDHEGIAQIVVEPDGSEAVQAVYDVASKLGYEDCVRVTGVVRKRHNPNDQIKTGQVEVVATHIEVMNKAKNLPFALHESPGEDTRLKYRHLDLRRPTMQKAMRTRSALVRAIRQYLDARDFLDIETPILTKATPEGARDYLVPSRVHAGAFYALPQSPQLFKQILMMSGMDRYYQIARCFRDEDLRGDRQPEFTQLDMEFAWVEEADIQTLIEDMLRSVFKDVIDVTLPEAFPRMTWHEAMRKYGSDKPDLRIDLEFVDVAEAVKNTEFKVFSEWANHDSGRVCVLRVPGGAKLSRKQIDGLGEVAAKHGAKGLAWLKAADEDGRTVLTGPIAKFLADAEKQAIIDAASIGADDLLLFGAGLWLDVCNFMGAVRLEVGKVMDIVTPGWKPLWVTDFPMFEFDADENRYVALHHPFTAPKADDLDALKANAATALSRGYDVVLNGWEIGGGSIRIHRSDMQSVVFELLGIGEEEARNKFGFLLDALDHGAPPHGGIALGIDRIAAIMAGVPAIRDVIAFPKTTQAQCLMTEAPSAIAQTQLDELHITTQVTEQSA